MKSNNANHVNSYQILIREIGDQFTTEWLGSLTFIPQENGETCLDLTFNEQIIPSCSHDQLPVQQLSSMALEVFNVENNP